MASINICDNRDIHPGTVGAIATYEISTEEVDNEEITIVVELCDECFRKLLERYMSGGITPRHRYTISRIRTRR